MTQSLHYKALSSEQSYSTKRTDKVLKMEKRPSVKGRLFLTEVENSSVSFVSNVVKPESFGCCLCQKRNHELETCRIFLRKPVEERKAFVKDKKCVMAVLALIIYPNDVEQGKSVRRVISYIPYAFTEARNHRKCIIKGRCQKKVH